MGRRPMCIVCLLLMLLLFCLDLAGFSFVRGNPLDQSVEQELLSHPQVTAVGEAVRCADTQNSHSVYLRQVCLICRSEKFPIKNLRVYLKEKTEVPAGALIVVSGKLEEIPGPRNPGEFDRKNYYAAQGIWYLMKNAGITRISSFHSLPGQLLAGFGKNLRECMKAGAGEDAPLFEAMLLGEKQDLDPDTRLRYQAAGILHILAISGLHISLLGTGVRKLCMLAGAGLYASCFIALLVMIPYGILTGESVSVIRAVCMFLLSAGARILGRTYDPLNALAFAAILLLLERPACLFDSSFLMSFSAVLGISILSPALKDFFEGPKQLTTMLGVQLMMLPVLLSIYGEVSLTGLLLNLAVLPGMPVILVSGIAGSIAGITGRIPNTALGLWPAAAAGRLSGWLFLPGRILLHGFDLLCDWALRMPCGIWTAGCPHWGQTILYYSVLGISVCGMSVFSGRLHDTQEGRRSLSGAKKYQKRFGKLLVMGVLLGNCLLLGIRPAGRLRITCLDVGQGDGIVVETPNNRCILIDGGSSDKKNTGTTILLPFLRQRGHSVLDAVCISHMDEDHVSGILELLEKARSNLVHLRIGRLILPEWKSHNENYEKLLYLARESGIAVDYVKQGSFLQLDGLSIRVLAPFLGATGEDGNNDSEVLYLRYGEFDGLFTGDIGTSTEEALLPVWPDVDFLKAAHHGSRYATGDAFLERAKPELAVVSCSEKNRYGHPANETVRRLKAHGVQVEYTMKSGAVTVETDGRKVWLDRFCDGRFA